MTNTLIKYRKKDRQTYRKENERKKKDTVKLYWWVGHGKCTVSCRGIEQSQ